MVAVAMGIETGYVSMLLVVGVVNLAGLIPASPGQLGVFEFFTTLVLTCSASRATWPSRTRWSSTSWFGCFYDGNRIYLPHPPGAGLAQASPARVTLRNSKKGSSHMKIGIIGAGVAGMSAAWDFLANAGP